MWNLIGDCITKVARKVLGVFKGGLAHVGDNIGENWWWCEDV